uniref:Protein kinase domain-containing protein n=3 Tax=Amphimedon queenslandica TaxID=400682 RepID=A0A1X7TK55_AMPQE
MAHGITQEPAQDRKQTRKPSIADPEFSGALKPLLLARRLTESDLQVNVKKEEIKKITCPDNDLIGRDWYSFGLQKEIDLDTLNQIKEDNSTLRDRKSDLLHLLIEPKYQIRYEDIVYFHFKNDQSQFIKRVLDYLVDQRRTAQVREPEAITPLALATRDAKIVLAGDDKQVGPKTLVLGEEAQSDGLDVSLVTRLTDRYKGMGPTAATYVTTLSSNYCAHKDLLSLPELFYGKLHASENKPVWHHKGPSGYRFVCSNSRLVPECVAANEEQQLVEACIVLEQPSNILFAMNDSIKVGDFGLVKQNAATKHSAPQTDVQGSHTSEIGTLFYVSPEQEAGHQYNERADVYSLGIILFELYFPFSTRMERVKVLEDIKSNRRLPKEFKENLHNEAKLVELMLKPISDRPSSSEIKEIDAFKQMKDQAELNRDSMLLKF